MTITALIQTQASSYSGRSAGNYMRFRVDTEAELPETDVINGDSGFTVDTGHVYIRTAGAWVDTGSTPSSWGDISGTLADQTDLQTALDAKQASDAQLTSLAGLAYAGNTLKVVRVNAGETAFELATAAGGGDLLAANNLSDVASATTSATNIGLGTGNSPQFTALNVGHATDTTLTRVSAGVVAVEGVNVLLNGGALGTPSSGSAANLTSFPTLNQNTTGSAAKLTTARTINGTSFDGTANINAVPASTCGVGASPNSSSTQQITHGLGRTPITIRIYGLGNKQSSTSASNDVTSFGLWCASGNACINRVQGASAGQASSTAFAIKVGSGATAFCSGVIGNVGATTFDIVWTESGTADTTPVYLWEAN